MSIPHPTSMESQHLVTVSEPVAVRSQQGYAANDAAPERRQLEGLLLDVLEKVGANYAFVLSPAGKGSYAEQFMKLSAVAERDDNGELRTCHDTLASRLPDPMILSVMRLRRGVCGKPVDIGLPTCLPGSHPPIRFFLMVPIEAGTSRTLVLFVANPANTQHVQDAGGAMGELMALAATFAEFQGSGCASESAPMIDTHEDSGARHYVQLMSAAINAVVITDASGTITAFNPSAESLFGCDSAQALGSTFDRYLPQEFLMPILKRSKAYEKPVSAADILPISQRPVAAVVESGNTVHLSCSAYHTRVGSDVYTTFVFEHENVTQSVHDTNASHQQFKALTNVAPVGIVQLGEDWTCDYANEMWCQLSGLSMDETLGEGWVDAIHAEDVVDTLVDLREILSKNQIFSRNIRLQRPTGNISWVTLSATITISDTGHFSGCLLVLLDVTEAHLSSEKLRYAATHDVLTGLANRAAFLDVLQTRLATAEQRRNTALLYLDLDGFKAINDTLGHDCGDELLRAVAARLTNSVAADDLCARLGGDEFTVIISNAKTLDEICNLAERIVRSFRETFDVFGNELFLSTSIGIARAGGAAMTTDALIKQADTALYKAKASGRSRWVVYTKEFHQADVQRSVLQARVRRATENQEFSLAYQPQYRVDDGSLIGFEALLRWYPDDMDSPDTQDIVDLLEDSGQINEVGQWVLETACQQYCKWAVDELLPARCTMSVNVSPAQLNLASFADRLRVMMARCNMPATALNLEITESALIEKNSSCIRVIDQVKALGVSVSLDDFGTGYASLSYLTRLPIDYLKIDKSFIMNMRSDESSRTIVMSVLAMAATLNIEVVAEGIEDQATLDELRGTNCQFMQGYHLCKPASASVLEPMLIRFNSGRYDCIELG